MFLPTNLIPFDEQGILQTAEQLQIKGLCEVNNEVDASMLTGGDVADANIVTVVAPSPIANSLKRKRSTAKRQRTDNYEENDIELEQHQQEELQEEHEEQDQQQDESPNWFTATDSTAGDEVAIGGEEHCDEMLDDEQNGGHEEGDVFISTSNSEHNNVVVLEQRVVTSGPAGSSKGLSNLQLGLVSVCLTGWGVCMQRRGYQSRLFRDIAVGAVTIAKDTH